MFSLVLLTPSYALGLPPGRQTWLQVHFPLGRSTTMTKTEGKTNGKFISCFSELILYERYLLVLHVLLVVICLWRHVHIWSMNNEFTWRLHSIKNAALGISTAFFSAQVTEGFHVSRFFRGFWRSDLNLNYIHEHQCSR